MIVKACILFAIELIKLSEGFSGTPYKCPAGYLSIGYGRNIEVRPLSEKEESQCVKNNLGELSVSSNIALEWLSQEVKYIYSKIENEDYFKGIGDARQAVVIDLIYNMGFAGFSKFKNFIKALENKDYNTASYELEHGTGENGKSHYFHQVKSRAVRNIEIIRSGEMV